MPTDNQQGYIPTPPPELYVRKNRNNTTGEKTRAYILEKIDCKTNEGIFVYRVGATYPEKGWPTPEGLFALNQVKRLIREFLELCKNPLIALGVVTYDKEKLMDQFVVLFDKMYEVHTRKMEFLCPASKNFYLFVSNFLKDCGYSKDGSEQFAFRLAQIPEMDDAYRYRLQDLCTSYDPENAPRNEVKRLGEVYIKREHDGSVKPKIHRIIKLLQIILLVPKYNRAFNNNVKYIKAMSLDEGDKYWCSLRSEYDYDGKTYEEKQEGLIKPQIYETFI